MVSIDKNLDGEIMNCLEKDNIFIITDSNVLKLYPRFFYKKDRLFIIKAGENSKTFDTVSEIISSMIEKGCNRRTTVVAIGGGVTGDIAGFSASLFMRGVRWVNVPTTLLSQVDSSVGGKTGVNFNAYKNIIGAFHSPKDVIISCDFLDTLPDREKLSGLGEIVKTAILDKELFGYMEDNIAKVAAFENESILYTVRKCIEFKEKVVEADPFERTGLRKILNLGHTVGHSLESEGGYKLSHGEYVLWGLWIESYIARSFIDMKHYLSVTSLVRRVLKDKKLNFDAGAVAHTTLKDKKNDDGKISIMVPSEAGKQREFMFTEEEIKDGLESWKKEYVR